jgi:hypothetical protein
LGNQKKVECCGYPKDYRAYAEFAITGISPKLRRASFDWMFTDLLSKVDSLGNFPADTIAALQKASYIELFLESYIDCYSLPEHYGFGKTYADARIASLEKRIPDNLVIRFVREQTDSRAVAPARPVASLQEIARNIRSSSKLLTGVGIVMMMKQAYEEASSVFERAFDVDPSDYKPKVYLAASEYQRSPRNIEKIRNALEFYFNETKQLDATRMNAEARQVREIAESVYKSIAHQNK